MVCVIIVIVLILWLLAGISAGLEIQAEYYKNNLSEWVFYILAGPITKLAYELVKRDLI